MRFIWFCLFLALGGTLATAQEQAKPQRMISAFQGWAHTHGIQNGVISVWHEGKNVQEHAFGINVNTPVEMASLSKAITGVCVAELIRRGKFTYQDRFNAIVGHGPDVTIAQLLTHASGLKRDSTQKIMRKNLGRSGAQSNEVLAQIIKRAGPKGKPNMFHYNNENYALLGLVIEALTGESYREICERLVLKPAGSKAVTSPLTDGFLPWGGWKMTAEDYARFLNHWFGSHQFVRENSEKLPTIIISSDTAYGLGMFERHFAKQTGFSHHGALCAAGRIATAGFAALWPEGWSVVLNYGKCVSTKAMVALQKKLTKVVMK